MNSYPSIRDLPPPPPGKSGWPWTEESSRASRSLLDKNLWPRVSIVTPSLNQGDYLEETIRSILLQGYPNLEYWVIDGGSSDQSMEIIHRYESWMAGWVSENDRGQSDAINKGWSRSTGELVGWINSDDVLLPDAIIKCVEFFEDHPKIGFVYGDLEVVGESGEFLRLQKYEEFNLFQIISECGWISQPGNLFRRSVLSQIGSLDPNLHFLMDLDMWIKVGFVTDIGYLPIPLAKFRMHSDSKTLSRTFLAAQEIKIVYERIYSRPDLPERLVLVRKRALSSSALYSARSFYSVNRLGDALRQFMNSAGLYPWIVLERRFWSLGLRIILAIVVGGTRSTLFQKIRGFVHS